MRTLEVRSLVEYRYTPKAFISSRSIASHNSRFRNKAGFCRRMRPSISCLIAQPESLCPWRHSRTRLSLDSAKVAGKISGFEVSEDGRSWARNWEILFIDARFDASFL